MAARATSAFATTSGRPVTTTSSGTLPTALCGAISSRSAVPGAGSAAASASSASVPVRPDAADALEHRLGRRDDQQHLPRAQSMCADEPRGRTDGVVEARGAARTRDRPGVDVEDDGDALARCVLELPHHQLAAPGRRRPVHGAERLSLDVFPDPVRLEPARTTNERPPAAVAPRARVGEERVELRDPRTDGHERGRLHLDHRTSETERVARDQTSPVEPVAPSRHCVERDVCAAVPGDGRRPRAERAEALLPDERAAEPAAAVHLGLDRERLSLDRRAVERPALDRHSLHDEPPPGSDRDRCEREADPHQRERRRPDEPGAGEDTGGERTRAAKPAHTGAGVASSASVTTSSTVTPVARASGARMSRWASTGAASEMTSSGTTKSRRSTSARAFARRSSAIPERGLPPSASLSLARVWRRSATTNRLIDSSTWMSRAAAIAATSSLVLRDGLQLVEGWLRRLLGQHARLLRERRVADRHPHREPVELRLGERVRPLVLDRVLGRDDEERAHEHVCRAVDGDLPLLHRLEQRRLRLRRRSVDLVDEHDVREHRAGPEAERPALTVEHVHARDVRRQEIGRELDAVEREVERARERLREHGLADTGDVLDEDVPLGEQAQEREPQRLRRTRAPPSRGSPRPAPPCRRRRRPRRRPAGARRSRSSTARQQTLDLVEDLVRRSPSSTPSERRARRPARRARPRSRRCRSRCRRAPRRCRRRGRRSCPSASTACAPARPPRSRRRTRRAPDGHGGRHRARARRRPSARARPSTARRSSVASWRRVSAGR